MVSAGGSRGWSARARWAAAPSKRRARGRQRRRSCWAAGRACAGADVGAAGLAVRSGAVALCPRGLVAGVRLRGRRRFAGWPAKNRLATLAQAGAHRRPTPAAAGGLVGLRWRAPPRTRLPEHQTSGRRSSSPMLPAMMIISAEACRTVKSHAGPCRWSRLHEPARPAHSSAAETPPKQRNGEGFRLPRSTSELTRSLALDFGALGSPLLRARAGRNHADDPKPSPRRARVEKCELLSSGRACRPVRPVVERRPRARSPLAMAGTLKQLRR